VPSPGFGRGAGIAEQIEEEKSAAQIVDQLRMVGGQRGPLLFIDRHLGKRSE
jgi:ferritin